MTSVRTSWEKKREDYHMLLIKNANVLTLNPAQPRAEAVLIDGDWIKHVGSAI